MDDTILIGGAFVTNGAGKLEEWDAPSGAVAQRWADEINARGGCAEVASLAWGDGSHPQWKVRILRSIPQHRITPSP